MWPPPPREANRRSFQIDEKLTTFAGLFIRSLSLCTPKHFSA